MWTAKIKINGEKALIGSRTKKFNVSVSGYPISFYEKKNGIYVYLIGFIFGNELNKKRFIDDLKKDKRVLYIEGKNDFFIGQIREPSKFRQIYHHRIVHLEPVMIKEDGSELWSIGSWNKQELINFIKLVKKTHNGELLKIKQEKIKNFSIISMQPELTLKQRTAIELAIRYEYYNYPRKIELKKLARLMNLSYSTYQAHLRKAEQKLLPFFFARSR